jgi:hypothetical protein
MSEKEYSVGDLKIAFQTIDNTATSFKDLKTNLQAVEKFLTRISNVNITPFVNNIKKMQEAFSPLLTDLNNSKEGLTAFSNIVTAGAKNISKASKEFKKFKQDNEETALALKDVTKTIETTNALIERPSYGWTSYGVGMDDTTERAKILEQELNRLNEVLNKKTYSTATWGVGTNESQWKNLYATLNRNLYGGAYNQEIIEELAKATAQYKAYKKVVDDTNEAFKRMTMTNEELVVYNYKTQQSEKEKRIEFLQTALATEKLNSHTTSYVLELRRLKKELNKTEKASRKSSNGFKRLWYSIKRIALYRIIRGALKAISSGLQEGLDVLAQYDPYINKIMSQLSTTKAIITTSFAMTMLPFFEALAPILQNIAVGFANIANAVSAAMAKMQGLATYTKINTDRLLEYNSATNKVLLDFDKFRSLTSSSSSAIDLLSTESVESYNGELTTTISYIKSIRDIISTTSEIISPILTFVGQVAGYLLDIINSSNQLKPILQGILVTLVAMGVTKIISYLLGGKLNSAITLIALGIGLVAYNMSMLINNWSDMSTGEKVARVFLTIASAAITATAAILALKGSLTSGLVFGGILALITGLGLSITASNLTDITKKANGGGVQSGTLFYAGEAGAEIVSSDRSGSVEVTNTTQMENSVYNGLVRWSREQGSSASITVPVNIDGQKAFEVIRKVAKSKGLDFAKK